MSLERQLNEKINKCENCGRVSISHMIIKGRTFCNIICFSEWKWKREKMKGQ